MLILDLQKDRYYYILIEKKVSKNSSLVLSPFIFIFSRKTLILSLTKIF